MFTDARNLPDHTTLEADLAIIGGGIAGITLARALAGSRSRVCVIESGGLDFDPQVQSLYEGENTGIGYSTMATRLRFFGGSSNHWGGYCRPLEPIAAGQADIAHAPVAFQLGDRLVADRVEHLAVVDGSVDHLAGGDGVRDAVEELGLAAHDVDAPAAIRDVLGEVFGWHFLTGQASTPLAAFFVFSASEPICGLSSAPTSVIVTVPCPGRSTVRPFSRAMSWVRSSGNP